MGNSGAGRPATGSQPWQIEPFPQWAPRPDQVVALVGQKPPCLPSARCAQVAAVSGIGRPAARAGSARHWPQRPGPSGRAAAAGKSVREPPFQARVRWAIGGGRDARPAKSHWLGAPEARVLDPFADQKAIAKLQGSPKVAQSALFPAVGRRDARPLFLQGSRPSHKAGGEARPGPRQAALIKEMENEAAETRSKPLPRPLRSVRCCHAAEPSWPTSPSLIAQSSKLLPPL